MRIGILGCGHIAEKMAATLADMPEMRYAAAARELSRAREFASRYGFAKAYGSYLELLEDKDVDLVYIATPHSFHYEHARLAIEHGKAVLCEKSFMLNARQTEEIFALAKEKKVFITEAIWTRYMPFSLKLKEIVDSGLIGHPQLLYASLAYPISHKERLVKPELGGGALLDVGVYTVHFARMMFGGEIESISGQAVLNSAGMDMQDVFSFRYADGRIANLQCSALCANDRQGIVSGDKGYLVIDNINNPLEARLYNPDHELLETFKAPAQITGFEYQVRACEDALAQGLEESPYIPHAETLAVMRVMDALRSAWGVVFPGENAGGSADTL